MLSKGQKINERYEIVKSIGEGGMANVYLADDKILDRKVAIKVLRGDLSADDKFIRRFEREAQSVSNLSHPNIVEVYDVGVEDGNHYIVMEYIEGNSVSSSFLSYKTHEIKKSIKLHCIETDKFNEVVNFYEEIFHTNQFRLVSDSALRELQQSQSCLFC